jgi:2-oxoglutarate ferredoxin oxidoreductase subunit beta
LYPGTALIDIVSPCVTFANHVGSTKSYTAVKQAHSPLQELGFISPADEIKVDYNEGESVQVRLHDGSTLHLKKLRSEDHDISDASKTLKLLFDTRQSGLVLTGLLHYNSNLDETLLSQLQLTREPLAKLNAAETRPSQAAFESLLKAYR